MECERSWPIASMIALVLAVVIQPADAQEWGLEDGALFVVLTHKGGFAAGLAHDHLIAAENPTIRAQADPSDAAATTFELKLEVAHLAADDPAWREAAQPRLIELGLLEEPFEELSEKDRAKIRKAMLGKSQLDAERHPRISVQVLGITPEPRQVGEVDFSHTVSLAFTVRGETVEIPAAARLDWNESGGLEIEAVGESRFSDFGIKPYSAALGAVKNQDGFHLYARLTVLSGRAGDESIHRIE